MSQDVSCPKCGHVFEVNEVFERYEKMVAEIIGGKCAPRGTPGYDVKDRDGITTYQVKYSNFRRAQRNGWAWSGSIGHTAPDFIVLFGRTKHEDFIFLMDYKTAMRKCCFRYNDIKIQRTWIINARASMRSWIMDFRTTPETFMQKRDELLRTQQLRLEIESQCAL